LAYTHTSFAQAKAQLAARLHDSSMVFYLDAELGGYIKEALYVFGALTGFWRERGSFNTAANVTYYDLPTQLPTLLGFTITDRDLVNDIQYHLLEAANDWTVSTVWGGTAQFTMDDVVKALQHRRNQFLAETGMVLTQATTAEAIPTAGRISLADTIIDVRRAVWRDAVTTVLTHLWREDEGALTSFSTTWASDTDVPYACSVLAPPPLALQVAPPPLHNGTLDLITVSTGATLDVTTGVILGLPDDWCWVIKWGALADLLGKDGPAMDPARAAWCEQRYHQGVQIAREVSCIVQAKLSGVSLWTDSLQATDAAYPNWQGDAAAAPTDIAVAGYNLIAMRPVPIGVYALTFDVVRCPPMPINDAAQLQIGREQLDAILNYAEHLALFKVAGPEWQSTQRAADNFLVQALTSNDRLKAAARYISPVLDQSKKERYARPRRTPETPAGEAA
jgi:hypothetical protein